MKAKVEEVQEKVANVKQRKQYLLKLQMFRKFIQLVKEHLWKKF